MPSPSESPARRLRESWRDNAGAWTAAVRAGAIESRRVATDAAILNAVLDRRPRRVLDLGCGEGWLVRALAERGVAALGVDGSAPLIEAASAAGGSFRHLTYAELIEEPARCGEDFDMVAANFALLEERVEPLLAALRRIMTANGWLLVQTLHPLAAGDPYRDGWRTEDFRGFGEGTWTPMPWYFRTLASWLAVLRASGFALRSLREPAHPQDKRPLSLLLELQPAVQKGSSFMSLEPWIAFTLASSALLAMPGPTVLVVVSYALGRGRASAWATVPGVALGDLTAMTISLLSAGAVLAASATLFAALKLCGAGYLIWLGIQLWRADATLEALSEARCAAGGRRMFWNSYVVTALNPKSIVFFIAFVPQFVDPAAPLLAQFAILEATFVALAPINAALWALLAGQMRARFQKPSTLRLVNRIGGSFLIGAGLLTAAARRAA